MVGGEGKGQMCDCSTRQGYTLSGVFAPAVKHQLGPITRGRCTARPRPANKQTPTAVKITTVRTVQSNIAAKVSISSERPFGRMKRGAQEEQTQIKSVVLASIHLLCKQRGTRKVILPQIERRRVAGSPGLGARSCDQLVPERRLYSFALSHLFFEPPRVPSAHHTERSTTTPAYHE
jgi:hypothetical protein